MGRWVGDCDWRPPVRPLYPLCSRASPCCYYCCFCLCFVGTSSFYLNRLSCPILAAAVLLLYHADAAETLLSFPPFFPLKLPAPPHSDISFPFRQTPDCSDILAYITMCAVFTLTVLSIFYPTTPPSSLSVHPVSVRAGSLS